MQVRTPSTNVFVVYEAALRLSRQMGQGSVLPVRKEPPVETIRIELWRFISSSAYCFLLRSLQY